MNKRWSAALLLFGSAMLAVTLPLDTRHVPGGSATGKIAIEMRVLDESGAELLEASIKANDVTGVKNSSGRKEVWVTPARRYEVLVSVPGFYSMLHTYSEQERRIFEGHFPAVTLVKKTPGRVMMAFTGDVMMGRRYRDPNPGDPVLINASSALEDSKALLQPIRSYLKLADYVSVNLETPVVAREPQTKSTKGVTFYSQPETLAALSWAGVDHVSLGNNHTYDYFDGPLIETLNQVAASGLGYSGAGLNAEQAARPYRDTITGVDYSFFGYVGWAGKVSPSQVAEGDSKGGAALGTQENIVNGVSGEDSKRVSVVEYHGSNEYSYGPTDLSRTRLHAAIDGGADIVIGHHPHVLHGFELYEGKLIAYSLGNFLFDQYIYETQRSALLYVWMDGENFHRAEVVPLYIKTYRPTPAMGKMREYVLRRLRHQSSLENLSLGLSGGHAIIRPYTEEFSGPHLVERIALESERQLIVLENWSDEFEQMEFRLADVFYRVGRDWWALGDHEQEQQFQLVDRSWKYSNNDSGIARDGADDGFAMKLVTPRGDGVAVAGQQYFTRVWDGKPKTIAVEVHSEAEVNLRVCLEIRTQNMSTAQSRANPVVECLPSQRAVAGQVSPLFFDFEPPPRATNRGLRFRLEVSSLEAGESTVFLDNLKFISWEKEGISNADDAVSLDENSRWNIVEISSSAEAGALCCDIVRRTSAVPAVHSEAAPNLEASNEQISRLKN